MAGESPDKSKQRESSAEPTSGSAGPVPEARSESRDPRLAVARTSEPDTSTKILALPKDTPDEDDARLREAVAAWVTKAAPAEEQPEEPSEDTSAASEEPEEAPEEPEEDADQAEAAPAAEKAEESAEEQEPEAKSEPEAEDASEDDHEPAAADGEDVPQGPPAADDESRTGGAGGKTETAEGEAEAEQPAPEPAAADGEDAPQGPPAADDESRTGGAGGKTETAEGEAEAEQAPDEPADDDDGDGDGGDAQKPAEAETGVDQPTTMFKAVRPKPAVDQPTTMLKLGDKAPKPDPEPEQKADPKADPEPEQKPEPKPTPQPAQPDRTSKFVALKPADPPQPAQQERTTQQPLPPKPPLDLLAELTNTPPPPQTPLRTAARRVKIWTPLVLLLIVVFAVAQSLRPLPNPELTLTAKDSYTFDGDLADMPWPQDGQAALDVQGIGSFGSSGEQKPVPIASVAKVMTAYLILRDHPLKSGVEGPMIKVDQAAEEQASADGESTVKVTAGDSISQREALESILIASANNVARLLARWDAGSEKGFVAKMNAAAEDLGMTNTTYTDPSGLNDTTVSTAVDQVKLAKAAMKEPAFREVAAMMEYYDYKGARHPNWNQLVGKNDVVGIKTGTTTSARGNLVFAAKKEIGGETRTIVGAVLRQPEGGYDNTILQGALSAGDKLIRAAQERLESATILKKGDVVGYVDDGLGGRTPVVVTKDVTAVGWAGLKVELNFAADELPHTAKAGSQVGTLTVGDGGTAGAVKVPVALQGELVEPGWTDKLTRIA
ncbi:D-alanyl-D-alanine carboxypeptidase [Streptomyces sp. NPDC096205]|uniref:D-alanyl-D-alanine carboxypeptidase n=1 Tax=Streptomyces sp. NPDC096205 TaxID=3366081 RepID=UPI0037FB0A3E